MTNLELYDRITNKFIEEFDRMDQSILYVVRLASEGCFNCYDIRGDEEFEGLYETALMLLRRGFLSKKPNYTKGSFDPTEKMVNFIAAINGIS